ncbi:ABC transporter permease [Bacillus sp. FSL W7-1360]
MRIILWNYWRHLLYRPWYILGFFGLAVIFSYAMGQTTVSKQQVPVYTEDMTIEETDAVIHRLNEHEVFHFELKEKQDIEQGLRDHDLNFAVALEANHFRFLSSVETGESRAIYMYLTTFYEEEQMMNEMAEQMSHTPTAVRNLIEQRLENPVYTLKKTQTGGESDFKYDQALQSLFGFSLYFTIMTISFTLSTIVYEKQSGLWDRLMMSPLRKTQAYLGHMTFSFLLGYGQLILMFILFKYGFGVDFYGGFWVSLVALIPYVFATVSLGVMISGFVSNARQLDVLIPLVSTSMAMVGGAFWPLEVVGSNIVLFISKFIPITYGISLLKGVTVNEAPMSELLFPASILMLMGVLFMSIGLNMMERKASR